MVLIFKLRSSGNAEKNNKNTPEVQLEGHNDESLGVINLKRFGAF